MEPPRPQAVAQPPSAQGSGRSPRRGVRISTVFGCTVEAVAPAPRQQPRVAGRVAREVQPVFEGPARVGATSGRTVGGAPSCATAGPSLALRLPRTGEACVVRLGKSC